MEHDRHPLDVTPPDRPNMDRAQSGDRPVRRRTPDREVPIFSENRSPSSEVLDQWLDGDVSDSVMLATDDGDDTVDLWNKIHDEAELLRSRKTPLYVHKRIMDSLPDDLYRKRVPWYRRPVPVNPMLLIAIALGLVALGVAIMKFM